MSVDEQIIHYKGDNFATIVDSDGVPRPVTRQEAQMAVWCGVELLEYEK